MVEEWRNLITTFVGPSSLEGPTPPSCVANPAPDRYEDKIAQVKNAAGASHVGERGAEPEGERCGGQPDSLDPLIDIHAVRRRAVEEAAKSERGGEGRGGSGRCAKRGGLGMGRGAADTRLAGRA